MTRMPRLATFCGVSLAGMGLAQTARAQVAPVPYLGGVSGLNGSAETQFWGEAPDEDGFRKGFSFRGFSTPVNGLGSGLAFGGMGSYGFNLSGLTAGGAQYGYSFKGIGDTPVTLFGGVNSLRSTPDVFTSLVTPGFTNDRTLATSINAGIAFKPTSNISVSFSAGYVQPSGAVDGDLSSQFLAGQQPLFLSGRR